jgi:alpha 1,2-mannosyltransferase
VFDVPSPGWSNFEIADMDFFRGEAYQAYFEHLEAQGGFYYEARRTNLLSRTPAYADLIPTAMGRRARAQVSKRVSPKCRIGQLTTPPRSIAAALFLPTSAIHFFRDIGYTHAPFTHCPLRLGAPNAAHCDCRPADSFDDHRFSCTTRWRQHTWRAGAVWRYGPWELELGA